MVALLNRVVAVDARARNMNVAIFNAANPAANVHPAGQRLLTYVTLQLDRAMPALYPSRGLQSRIKVE